MKIVNQKYQPMIIEKRYSKCDNRNLIAMNKNELQTLNNLPLPSIAIGGKRGAVKRQKP
jgi:DNA-binding Xre family transcriptional regulator